MEVYKEEDNTEVERRGWGVRVLVHGKETRTDLMYNVVKLEKFGVVEILIGSCLVFE